MIEWLLPYWTYKYQWARKMIGGRWELWFIDICHASLWLKIPENEPDDRYQPCSVGPRMAREDYHEV